MKDALIVSLLSILPRRTGARAVGSLARTKLSGWLTRAFVRLYGVDMREARQPLSAYPTLEALFTRELAPRARPIDPSPATLVSPVDGTVAAVGRTRDGRITLHAGPSGPGRRLELPSLLGEELEEELDVVVLYLSPKDYHRVHTPHEGAAVHWRYTPGTLWPVFPAAVRRVADLFSKNERVGVRLRTEHGPLDVVLVGAFGVGRITLSIGDIVTNARRGRPRAQAVTPPRALARGEELGVFHLGSTVVLAAPEGRWEITARPGTSVRMGQAIGRATRP